MNPSEQYSALVQAFLQQMEGVIATKREHVEGLHHALAEIEVALQAAKETA